MCAKSSTFAPDFKRISLLHIIYYMALKIVVLAKQVPDTRNVGKDAMTAEGTVNRAALPAIFNPEDLNALEQALRLKCKTARNRSEVYYQPVILRIRHPVDT